MTRWGRRWRIRPLTATAIIGVAAVLATFAWRMDQTRSDEARGDQARAPGGVSGSTVRVGVSDGDSVQRYVAAGKAELAQLAAQSPTGQLYALVSFSTYLAPAQVGDLAAPRGGLTTIAAYARVPLPRRQTELVRLPAGRVPEDVVAAMAEVSVRKAEEATDYSARAEAEDATALRDLYRSNAAVAAAESAAYRQSCACVFALVVRASAAVLTDLAHNGEVRVVDAAPEAVELSRTVFAAPLPEQVGLVAPPPDDELAPPTPSP